MCFSIPFLVSTCSSEVSASTTMGVSTSAVSRIMFKSSTSTSVSADVSNIVSTKIKGTVYGNVDIGQVSKVTMNTITTASNELSVSMLNSISTQLQQSMQQAITTATQLGSQEMAADAKSNMSFTINNVLSSSAIVNQVTAVTQNYTVSNVTKTLLSKSAVIYGNLTVSPSSICDIAATAVINVAASALASNEDFNKIVASLQQQSSSKNGGLAEAFDSFKNILEGPLKVIAMIVLIIFIGLAVLLVVRGMAHRHQDAAVPVSAATGGCDD